MLMMRNEGLRRHERMTLWHAYSGEFGRGVFGALCSDFAMVVAVTVFLIKDSMLLAILASAGFLGMMIPLVAGDLTVRWRKKTVIFAAEIVSRLIVVGVGFVTTGPAFALTMAAGIMLNAISVPLVSGIYSENFGIAVRGQAVSRLQGVAVGTLALTGALASYLLKVEIQWYRFLLVAISILSLGCSFYAYRLPEARKLQRRRERVAWSHYVDILRKDLGFTYVQVFWFILGLCNLWLMPLRVLHLQEIGCKPWQNTVATITVVYATSVFSVALWGKLIYRVNFALYRMAISGFFIIAIAFFFYGSTFPVICVGAFFWGLAMAGGELSWRLVATFFAKPGKIPQYMFIHSFLCGVRGIVGPYAALQLRDATSINFVANISIAGLALTILMLVPMVPMIERRRHLIAGARGQVHTVGGERCPANCETG